MEIDIKSILELYGLKIQDYRKIRNNYRCITDKGIKSLREVEDQNDRVIIEDLVKEHLFLNGFIYTDRFIRLNESSDFIAKFDNKSYVLTNSIEGEECELDNDNELSLAVETLSKLEEASKGFSLPEPLKMKDYLGQLPSTYLKRKNELERHRKKLKKELVRDEFDKLYLANVEMFIDMANLSIAILEKSKYNLLIDRVYKEQSFSHHDYAFHNIIIDQNKNINVIGFESASIDLRIYDLANIIKRTMRKCKWDFNKTKEIIKTFGKNEALTQEELEVLFVMLSFPQKFWRIINRYYNGKKVWSCEGHISKLKEEIDEEKYHKEFLKKYANEYLSKRNILELIK